MRTYRSTRARLAVAGLAFLGLAVAGCGSPASPSSSPAPGASAADSSAPTGSGTVNVLYAGSLVDMMRKQVGPALQETTGYSLTGEPGGSTALATDIKGKVYKGDVFISAAPSANDPLMGAANGNWVSWYAAYASSRLVLGYNPNSKFAADIRSGPWYKAITEPGIRIGFTDPAVDPKGVLTVEALKDTATSRNLPALSALAADNGDMFPEQGLVARVQSGQLDAGFFYTSEAVAAKVPTVPLTGLNLKATYTISIIKGAPHEAGAEAFVRYLLGPAGQAVLKEDGFTLVSPPAVTGTGVPSSLQNLLS